MGNRIAVWHTALDATGSLLCYRATFARFLLVATTVVHAAGLLGAEGGPAFSEKDRDASKITAAGLAPQTRTIQGRVVWLADALQRNYGITSVPESRDRILALETPQREMFVIVEDTRGRAFRSDARLRDQPVELLVRQYRGSPAVQVIRVFALRADGKYELDYWCDVCAIAMFELQPCSCCQGAVELRARRVDKD